MIKAVLISFNAPPLVANGIEHYTQINGGMTCVDGVLSEARDFIPNFSHLNSILFESSVILTSWQHMDQVFGQSHVAFVHDDITKTEYFDEGIELINSGPTSGASYGITTPSGINVGRLDFTDSQHFRCSNDPWWMSSFDMRVNVWAALREYDEEAYEYVKYNDIPMIYGHQFICTSDVFAKLGASMASVLDRVTLSNTGLWTPHVFERIIAIRLHMYSHSVHRLLNLYHHDLSSGHGKNKLYGVREYKFISEI